MQFFFFFIRTQGHVKLKKKKKICFLPVKMSNSDNLSSNIVVEPVHRAGVDETITNPESRFYNLLNLSLHLKDTRMYK